MCFSFLCRLQWSGHIYSDTRSNDDTHKMENRIKSIITRARGHRSGRSLGLGSGWNWVSRPDHATDARLRATRWRGAAPHATPRNGRTAAPFDGPAIRPCGSGSEARGRPAAVFHSSSVVGRAECKLD